MTSKAFILCPNCGSVEFHDFADKTKFDARQHYCTGCSSWLFSDEYEELKAISIKQPWAWAIVTGLKDIENRPWKAKFKGKILIHSGKKFDKKGFEFLQEAFVEAKRDDLPSIDDFKNWMGGIVGHVDVTGCVSESKSPWFFGPYGFTLENAQMIDIVKCNGQLSFFKPKIQ